MDEELDLLLGRAVNSLIKLEILLYLRQRPGLVQGPERFSADLRCPADQAATALAELSGLGLVERYALGTGRHVLYGAPQEERVRQLLELLYQRYHRNGSSRSELVRRVVGGGGESQE